MEDSWGLEGKSKLAFSNSALMPASAQQKESGVAHIVMPKGTVTPSAAGTTMVSVFVHDGIAQGAERLLSLLHAQAILSLDKEFNPRNSQAESFTRNNTPKVDSAVLALRDQSGLFLWELAAASRWT